MSNHVSAAQVTPSEVLGLVFEYLLSKSYYTLGNATHDIKETKEARSVCYMWRKAAIEYLWRELHLFIDENASEVYADRPTYIDGNWLPRNTEYLVKELSITVSRESIFSGAASDLLTKYMVDIPCLPHVYKLRIFLSDEALENNSIYDNATGNALEFAQLLKRIAPAAHSTMVTCDREEGVIEEGDEKALSIFMNHLFIEARNSEFDMGNIGFRYKSTIAHIPQLTSLSIKALSVTDARTILLHKCSNTLLNLNVGISNQRLLISDINGNSVVYPNLRVLKAKSNTMNAAAVITTPESIVPFPCLKSLSLNMTYPYSDDVLFRGNTLQYLKIRIDKNTVTRLNQYKVFNNKALQYVEITEASICANLFRIPESTVVSFLGNMLNTAQVLTVQTGFVARNMIMAMQNGYALTCIQHLYVTRTSLSLYVVLGLLRGLPILAKLVCGIYGMGSELELIPNDELPDHIAIDYENVGKCLHTWHLVNYNMSAVSQLARDVILLALACPKLGRVMVDPNNAAELNDSIANVLQRDVYDKYAEQLTQLHSIAY